MLYEYREQGDERLLELAALPLENGCVITMHTTGFSLAGDEIVELFISDFGGRELFRKRVNPQNVEQWAPSDASGGIAPDDVCDEPELYQFEDEIIEIVDKASIVVCEHTAFAQTLIEASWISLPAHRSFDMSDEFREAHCAQDYPGEPAPTTSLFDMCAYYDIKQPGNTLADTAEALLCCYRAFVIEHQSRRDEKGQAYWEERDRRLAEEAERTASGNATARLREKRLNQMNALLWVAGSIIFASLVIQLYQRGGDGSLMIVAGAVSAFCLIRAIINFRKS